MRGLVRMVYDYARWRIRRTSEPAFEATHPSAPEYLRYFRAFRPRHPWRETEYGVFLDGTSQPRENVESSINSVLEQIHQKWKLGVLTDDPLVRSRFGSEARIRILSPDVPYPEAVNQEAQRQGSDYVVLLSAGVSLHRYSLEWLSSVRESDLIYGDGDSTDGIDGQPLTFKPAWSPRLLLTTNYLNGLLCVKAGTFIRVGGLTDTYPGSELHELSIRLAEADLASVTHLPVVLHERARNGASQDPTLRPHSRSRLLEDTLVRRGWTAHPLSPAAAGQVWPTFSGGGDDGHVKVIIPTRDGVEQLKTAVDGVLEAVDVTISELVIIDNGSTESATIEYLETVARDPRFLVVRVDEPFNFSRLVNIGAGTGVETPFLLFLNNDVEAVDSRWLRQLVGWLSNDPRVVAVTPQLRYPDGRIQYGGTVLGLGGLAGHYGVGMSPTSPGLHRFPREVGAVTAACLLVRSSEFERVGGFAEDLPLEFQDVDLSIKLRKIGGTLMYDPTHPLIHAEGASRGRTDVDPVTRETFFSRWELEVEGGDPYYNPHLADAQWDDIHRSWFHDPNLLRPLPTTKTEAIRRLAPRTWTNDSLRPS